MRAFLGLVLLMGLVKKPTISSYWNEGLTHRLSRTPGFGEVMTRNRFQLLLHVIHASDNAEPTPRTQPGDELLDKFRPMFELVNKSFASNYRLARDVCVDERVVGFKGRHKLKQYLANKKKDKWGLQMWVLAESESGYTHQFQASVGRKHGCARPPGKQNVGHRVVMELMQPHLNKGHHVTLDSYFCSPGLCHALYDKGTFCTGTVAVRRQGMPKSFNVPKRGLTRGQATSKVQGPLLAVLWPDRKVFTMLTTLGTPRMEDCPNAKGRTLKIPSVVNMYNHTMGGVDLGDQFIKLYDPRLRSCKLWRKALFEVLLTAAVNAYVVYQRCWLQSRKLGRLPFQESIVASLVGDQVTSRSASKLGPAPHPLRLTGRHFPGVLPQKKRKQCAVCRGRSRVRSWCPDCGVGLCISNCFRVYHTVLQLRSSAPNEE
ncbi:piggyBac transposable element-derived protein 4-like [Haliotis cracherodii]|uniref:piggyBac transposable element-derived protein 4-like n=1 Tax=Haliotis cracherodii TaxID=6455 RepID=UPI0039E82FB4